LALALVMSLPLLAKYKIRKIQPSSAREYPAFQDFQKIVIGAYPCDTEAKILELFDTKKLHEKGIMPILLVVENNNNFAIRLDEKEIFLIDVEGTNLPAIPFEDVLLRITLKNPPSTYPTRKSLQRAVRDEEMLMDFEHKAFGEKLIAPHDSDYGVVFFDWIDQGDLAGTRLYFPSVFNFTEDSQLMFFEFGLGPIENE
jgi:hypothetical protein